MPEGASHKGGLLVLFCLGIIAGLALYSFHEHQVNEETIDYYIGQEIKAYGTVISEPIIKNKDIEFDFRVSSLATKENVSGKIRIRTNPYPRVVYGDYLQISCTLEAPKNTTFNYSRYLARYDIYSLCFRAKIQKTGEFRGNIIKKKLFDIKNYFVKTIELHVGEPESSLIGPVLFGGGAEIGDDIFASFRRTGLTHIMAVSGFNVGILAAGLGYGLFLLGLRRKIVFAISSLATVLYVILVGAPPSALRAGIMSIFILYSLALGRIARFQHIVIVTVALTLVFNPLLLTADIGWQLSFAAILGLLYLFPLLQKGFEKILPKRLKTLGDIMAATLAAQLSTTPISLFHFGQVSLIAPIANLFVVWTIPFLTAVSVFALFLASLVPALGNIFFLPSFLIAKYIIWIVHILGDISWASIDFTQ